MTLHNAYFNALGECLTITSATFSQEDFPQGVYSASVPRETNPNDIYWNIEAESVEEKTAFSVIVTPNTISDIPPGTTIHFKSNSGVIDDGIAEFTVSLPETLTVILEHPHHVSAIIEVSCEI